MLTIADIETRYGKPLLDHQAEVLARAAQQPGPRQRLCLHHKTGAGKSLTALAAVALWGHDTAVVVAPPSTHQAWEALGSKLGVKVAAMSHAKFRMKDTKLSRSEALIADEMHMFGGHGGKGWKKLEALAKGLQAPLVLASATPNYNDADRVYCIQRLLDPHSCKGGFLQFLYAHCTTEQNPFGMMPIVTGFQRYATAAEYLADLPNVEYLPDDLVYTITDVPFSTPVPWAYEVFGYDERRHRIVASGMEDRHNRTFMARVNIHGGLHDHVYDELVDLLPATGPVLVYCNHSTIAKEAYDSLTASGYSSLLLTGDDSKKKKEQELELFKSGTFQVLIGTATLATGTDGIDKICDRLIILDDTDDDSLRRQLIGRIMPRGEDTDASMKQVYRLLHQ